MNHGVILRFPACLALLCLAQGALQSDAAGAPPDDGNGQRIRIVVSTTLMGDVNENDARASLRVWASAITGEAGLKADLDRGFLATPEQLFQAVRAGQADGFAATIPEYLRAASYVDRTSLLLDEQRADHGEEYVILAHEESGIRVFQDLRGHSLALHKSAFTCLAPAWLQTLLVASDWPAVEAFFGSVSSDPKVSKGVILPVFFRQVDACLLTARSFATACELNPQLGRRLRVVAKSPPLVPVVMVLHKDCPPRTKQILLDSILKMQHSLAGRQVLTLFQSGRLVLRDASALGGTLELLAAAERIKAGAAEARR
jgi:ABC-type phosphate/phosphonate transport system substrate-binding protein